MTTLKRKNLTFIVLTASAFVMMWYMKYASSYSIKKTILCSRQFQIRAAGSSESSTKHVNNISILNKGLLLQGPVSSGYGRGSKSLGFPTANLPHFNSLLEDSDIKNGVYVGWANLASTSGLHPVVANIGFSPTFAGNENKIRIVEAHLLSTTSNNFNDFYGDTLLLFLLGFLRPEQKFSSLDALKMQIQSDVDTTRSFCERFRMGIDLEETAVNYYEISNKTFSIIKSCPSSNEDAINSAMKTLSASNVSVNLISEAKDVTLWARIPLR